MNWHINFFSFWMKTSTSWHGFWQWILTWFSIHVLLLIFFFILKAQPPLVKLEKKKIGWCFLYNIQKKKKNTLKVCLFLFLLLSLLDLYLKLFLGWWQVLMMNIFDTRNIQKKNKSKCFDTKQVDIYTLLWLIVFFFILIEPYCLQKTTFVSHHVEYIILCHSLYETCINVNSNIMNK